MLFRGLFTLVFSLALLCLGGGRAEAMRCSGRLASPGDMALSVRAICGEPAQIVRTTERRLASVGRGGIYARAVMIEIQVELWTYNLGPHRFMRQLRFENGVLVRERTLGYGH